MSDWITEEHDQAFPNLRPMMEQHRACGMEQNAQRLASWKAAGVARVPVVGERAVAPWGDADKPYAVSLIEGVVIAVGSDSVTIQWGEDAEDCDTFELSTVRVISELEPHLRDLPPIEVDGHHMVTTGRSIRAMGAFVALEYECQRCRQRGSAGAVRKLACMSNPTP